MRISKSQEIPPLCIQARSTKLTRTDTKLKAISNPIGQIDKYISKTKAISSQIGQIATYTSKIEGKIKTNS